MIKLEKVNKYFNRRKANEIHVIDNTTLELPDAGLVCLLGPSGCGKTTLLNAIGGLDKINGGKIMIDGERITGRLSSKIDTVRNAKIGYIFQNFNLIDDETVFENVAVALRMIGVKDGETVKKRVNYCLEAVGIYQYRNRKARDLSGGQRQRVSIARAIVKNPQIIIADEPTGNLDSGNTLDIMNLIKKMSAGRLIILVTHEEELANFYASRIIRLGDGRIISDSVNENRENLDYRPEDKIYLRDMPVKGRVHGAGPTLNFFADRPVRGTINIAVRGGNLFIDTGGAFSVIDETHDIELVDDHYRQIDRSIFESSRFNYDAFLPKTHKVRYKPVYTLLTSVWKSLKELYDMKFLRKLLLIGFVLSSCFAFYAVSNIAGIRNVDRARFMTSDEHYITVANPERNMKIEGKMSRLKGVDYIIPGESIYSFALPMNDLYQTAQLRGTLIASLASGDVLKEKDMYMGKPIGKERQMVVDKMVLKKFMKGKQGIFVGLTSYRKFIGRKIVIPNLGIYRICGISDVDSPVMFAHPSRLTDIIANAEKTSRQEALRFETLAGSITDMQNYDGHDDDSTSLIRNYSHAEGIKLKAGHAPEKDGEALINENMKGSGAKIGKSIDEKLGGNKLIVSGFYTSKKQDDYSVYVTESAIKKNNYYVSDKVTVYAETPEKVKKKLQKMGISAEINFVRDRQTYIQEKNKTVRSALIMAVIILIISLIEIYLMLRASFLSRIKEVGILRAIGVKKSDIYRKFAGEIIAITAVTSAVGIGLMYYVLSGLLDLEAFAGSYSVTPVTAAVTFAVIAGFNLLVGLIPVAVVMRRTPAQILARPDV